MHQNASGCINYTKRDFYLTHFNSTSNHLQWFTHGLLQLRQLIPSRRRKTNPLRPMRPNATSTQNANFRLPNLTLVTSPTPPPILPIAPVVDGPAFTAIRKAATGRVAIPINSGALRPVWRKA
jgi:hypothetical protein